MNVIVPKRAANPKRPAPGLVSSLTRLYPHRRPGRNRRRSRNPRRGGLSTEGGEPGGDAQRELDRDADVELRVGAALHEVLVEQVLEVEAADEGVALEASVGEVAARHARALAVLELADAAGGERAPVERGGELRGDCVERQEAVLVGGQRRIDEDPH